MRRRLVASDATELQAHDHTAWCGEGPRDLHDLAAAVFSSAVRRNERMLFVSEQPRQDWLRALDDVDALVSRDALRLIPVDEIYRQPADPHEQRLQFESELAQALKAGYSGLFVVADNTRLIGTTDDEFQAWLAWEAVADELQATRPLTGVCYFDRIKVPGARLDDLAAVHPVRCATFAAPCFQVFCDDETLSVAGEMDSLAADQIRRVIGVAVESTGRELDISKVGFIDHRALLTLEQLARSGLSVRVRGASGVVRRLWQLLDVPSPALEFC